MQTVSFELDTDLRLHPQKLTLGKAELLTDALTLPFTDIEKRLSQYISGSSSDEKLLLQKVIKSYLAKLNANPMIPLHYRLKVLGRFERELELFDAEMTAAVLNAHKIGVDLVRKAARNEPSYYHILVDMVSNALELAVKMLRIGLEKYQSPAVLTTRQVFDLMRLGLSVIPALNQQDISEKKRLFQAVANHEMVRMLDFYSKTPHEQQIIWQELQHHTGVLKPYFLRKADKPKKVSDGTFIITYCSRPNDAAKVTSSLPDEINSDLIIMTADHFVERLITAVDRVETVLKNPDLQRNDLHTEEALHGTIIGGNAILTTLRSRNRKADRQTYAGTRVVIEWDAAKAFKEANEAQLLDEYEFAPSDHMTPETWSIVDISQSGTGLERLGKQIPSSAVSSLIGMSWIPHNKEPMLGIVSWLKEVKSGEQRMGIHFFKDEFKMYQGMIMGGSVDDKSLARSWPVLVKPGKRYHTAVFPDCRIYKNMTFILRQDGKGAYFKVVEITKGGANYCICSITPAKELKTKQNFDFDS
ncbi:MAG: hypothetical protein Q9M14_01400 [Mariprofundaceae bacterium]|nr:hypothetical protein [Mariprofundaceae bacterium]